ncbi:MAG TPA: adenylate/guanylate cyclase domain-containing protein, partial [Longimicrobiales bacterium]|nr:adenylate/guanylate cyclase domain-containing protein [Longimicrobiales bacterium]
MRFRPLAALQRSFAAKLLVSLLGTVGLVVALALLVVRDQTARQVELVAERAAEQSATAFRQAEDFQRAQLAELAVTFTGSRRTAARVEEAVGGGEEAAGYLVEEIVFELAARRIPSSLVVLTDLDGEPILALRDAERLPRSADSRSVRHLARELLASEDFERFGYVRLDDRLFSAQATLLAIGNRLVGTVLLGLPVDDALADRLRALTGVEVCFVTEGECVVGTAAARGRLAPALAAVGAGQAHRRVRAGGERWEVRADPLVPERPGEGARVIAVPLEAVLAPFERITRALAAAAAAAIALAIVISIALSRGLTRPVQALVRATTAVAHGRYDTRVKVSSRDEMGRLADAFNEMTHGLLLKERYRGVLDKVVSPEIAEELLRRDIALGGENREVTTVFADINGFTPLSEGLEPQEVIAMINECMERLSRAIESAGGVVDKYIGDEVMGVFGAPVPQEDHARRAVVAAQRMRLEMSELNAARAARGQGALGVSIGLNSGVVVAGNMGSPDRLNYTVLGEAVNLAARLCSAAGRDEILVSAATHAR